MSNNNGNISMKKVLVLIFALISLFIATTETKAECPQGYAQIIDTLMVNNCLYQIEICAKCNVPVPPSLIYLNSFTKLNSNCNQLWSLDQVVKAIYDYIFNAEYIRTHVCTNPPPCDIAPYGKIYAYNEYTCFEKVLTSPNSITYRVCSNGSDVCRTTWLVCWKSDGTVQQTLVSGPTLISNGYNCPNDGLPPDPTVIGIPSSCFRLATSCDE